MVVVSRAHSHGTILLSSVACTSWRQSTPEQEVHMCQALGGIRYEGELGYGTFRSVFKESPGKQIPSPAQHSGPTVSRISSCITPWLMTAQDSLACFSISSQCQLMLLTSLLHPCLQLFLNVSLTRLWSIHFRIHWLTSVCHNLLLQSTCLSVSLVSQCFKKCASTGSL